MTGYPVHCYACPALAEFKIAATWSDGQTRELKTYSLCCAACLPELLADARRRQAACPLTSDETLDVPVVSEYAPRRQQ